MILQDKQFIFTKLLAQLLSRNTPPNVGIQCRELWRSAETCDLYLREGKGVRNSCHELGLAVDLNVFVNGQWSKKKADYEGLGAFWKSLSTPDISCFWGGDFHSLCDFYHFSVGHEGVR